MQLSGSTKIHELLKAHPFLEETLASYHPKFEMLRNRMARATIGRVATLRAAAGIAGVDLGPLLVALADSIEQQTGARPELDAADVPPTSNREERLAALAGIIRDLHEGGDLEEARRRFAESIEDVEASEIAAMEEELIRSGLPVSEVQRLCDVHVGAFRDALEEHPEVEAPAGHPVHTYRAANEVVTRLANAIGDVAHDLSDGGDPALLAGAESSIAELAAGLENHYLRKENQLFPLLERHDVTGPTQVMWGVHDQIRSALRELKVAARKRNVEAFVTLAPPAVRDVVEMVYKEEKILFPLAMDTLSDAEWTEVRHGEDELGYVLVTPEAPWPAGPVATTEAAPATTGLLALTTGALSLEQLNLVLTHLPVDLSFVDETDTVRFYSEGPERIFPRSPAVIGRKVQNCHPPDSVHVVQAILDAFRAGEQSVASFWIELGGRFIHIRYFAVRDAAGAYRGCLEVSQDATELRALEGERRLLSWGK